MYLIVGATGLVGSEICRLLSAAGEPARALVRPTAAPAKVENLKNLGVNIICGDLRNKPSIKAACRGVSTIIATASSLPFAYQARENTPQITDQDGYLSLITAAQEAGVRQFIYISFPPIDATFPLQDAKRAVEECLRSSSLIHTILQPTFFTEIWLSQAMGFDFPNRRALIYGDGENPMNWISYLDVARYAIASLDNPAAYNFTLGLGGAEALTPLDVVRLFESIGGKPFDVTTLPLETLQTRLAAATDPMQQSLVGLTIGYAHANALETAGTLPISLSKLRTINAYVQSVLS